MLVEWMSEFSETLTHYIKIKKTPIYTMAKYCGMDRSSLYKMMRGNRTPQNRMLIDKMAEFIHLTPKERDQLLLSWKITLVGAEDYFRRESVKNFLCAFPFEGEMQNHQIQITSFDLYEEPLPIQMISQKAKIEKYILASFLQEIGKATGKIDLIMPPQPDMIHMMSYIDKTVNDLSVRHILSLDSENDGRSNYNLDCIRKILPLYTYTFQYDAYYYYGSSVSGQDALQLFPYMVLTTKKAILLSSDFEWGLLIEEDAAIASLHCLYENYLEKSRQIAECIENSLQLIENIGRNASIPSDITYSFQMIPCVTPFLTPEIIGKYLTSELLQNEGFLKNLSQHIGLLNRTYRGAKFIEMFSVDGLRYFLEHGQVIEYPPEIYHPLSQTDCIRLVRSAMQASGQTYHYRLLKQSIGDVAYGANVYVNRSSGYLLFINPANEKMVYLNVRESSILQIFFDYFEHMEAELFYTDEEMNRIVEEVLREYERKE